MSSPVLLSKYASRRSKLYRTTALTPKQNFSAWQIPNILEPDLSRKYQKKLFLELNSTWQLVTNTSKTKVRSSGVCRILTSRSTAISVAIGLQRKQTNKTVNNYLRKPAFCSSVWKTLGWIEEFRFLLHGLKAIQIKCCLSVFFDNNLVRQINFPLHNFEVFLQMLWVVSALKISRPDLSQSEDEA